MNCASLFAERTAGIGTNAIREILKVVSQPGMVSLAGGIPAPESFPMDIIAELTGQVIAAWGAEAFQYGPSEGFGPLREALAVHLRSRGLPVRGAGDILVASGSQGVLDALGKIFIGEGDPIAVEAPTYLGALHAFAPYRPTYVPIRTDEDGVVPESLEAALAAGVKLVYLVPNFQNPTGRTLSLERRHRVAGIVRRHTAILVEDDPYGALRYRGTALPPIHALAPERVVYVGTFSKVFAPGLRVGFCVAPEAVRRWLVVVKQGTDLHTGTFNQALAAAYLSGGHLERVLPKITALYAPRLAAMLDALDRHFPAAYRWSRPEGGMFVWVEGPPGADMDAVYAEAVRRGVAFVPGRHFFPDPGVGRETMRLNFTMADSATIERAVKVLGDICADAGHRWLPGAWGPGAGFSG